MNEQMKFKTTYAQDLPTMEVNITQEIRADDDTPQEERPTTPTVNDDEEETETAHDRVVEAEWRKSALETQQYPRREERKPVRLTIKALRRIRRRGELATTEALKGYDAELWGTQSLRKYALSRTLVAGN